LNRHLTTEHGLVEGSSDAHDEEPGPILVPHFPNSASTTDDLPSGSLKDPVQKPRKKNLALTETKSADSTQEAKKPRKKNLNRIHLENTLDGRYHTEAATRTAPLERALRRRLEEMPGEEIGSPMKKRKRQDEQDTNQLLGEMAKKHKKDKQDQKVENSKIGVEAPSPSHMNHSQKNKIEAEKPKSYEAKKRKADGPSNSR
jgi:hypothetical protein